MTTEPWALVENVARHPGVAKGPVYRRVDTSSMPAHIMGRPWKFQQMYSKSRREAPIHWRLATPSASFSVWLYLHAFTQEAEGADGKWKARATPARPVEELVRERTSTSPAVKATLKCLMEAPVDAGASRRARRGKANA